MTLLRFAPSPTGFLHLGGLRTALFNHLYAKKFGGKWILRIEDTDSARLVANSVEDIKNSLAWAGLNYDYGPDRPGPHGPYFQSERLDLYKSYVTRLLDAGHAYHCFCRPERLATVKERLSKVGSNATYDKNCLNLTEEEVARRLRAGHSSVIRLNDEKIPPRSVAPDLVFGEMSDSHMSLPTDPILLKTDSFPTYHLASVVDDHEMGITHVLRGEEWLPSLPLHLDIYACLKFSPPQYAHLPLLLNADGSKMSKRKGDVAVKDFTEKRWERVSLLNWLVQSGRSPIQGTPIHNSGDKGSHAGLEAHSLEELIETFDLGAYTSRRTILDSGKLRSLNKTYLWKQSQDPRGLATLAQQVKALCKEQFSGSDVVDKIDFDEAVLSFEGRLVNITEAPHLLEFLFQPPNHELEEAKILRKALPEEQWQTVLSDFARHASTLQWWDHENIHALLARLESQTGLKHRDFMYIFRYALTGKKSGLGVVSTLRLLGPEESLARVKQCLQIHT